MHLFPLMNHDGVQQKKPIFLGKAYIFVLLFFKVLVHFNDLREAAKNPSSIAEVRMQVFWVHAVPTYLEENGEMVLCTLNLNFFTWSAGNNNLRQQLGNPLSVKDINDDFARTHKQIYICIYA